GGTTGEGAARSGLRAVEILFLDDGDFVQPDGGRIHAGGQRKAGIDADIRVFRLEIFFDKHFEYEARNLYSVEPYRIHMHHALSPGAMGVGGNLFFVQSAEHREQWVI